MKKLSFLLVGLLIGAGLYAQQVNDPNAEVRQAKGYHGINVSNAFDVYLSQSSEEAVAVSAAETKHREKITVNVKDGILYIGYDNDSKSWSSGNKKLKAYISFKQIDQLKISGACDEFIAGTLKAESLTVNQSGASDMMVTGTATQLSVEASGASDFKGFDLVTETCDAKASGASDIKITVNKELSAHASGASDVRYKGNGVIKDLKSSGSSSVSKG